MNAAARRLKANLDIVAGLEEALAKLQALTDVPGDERGYGRAKGEEKGTCAVPAEHRGAVRLYVESWAMAPLESALRMMRGDDTYEDRRYLYSIRTGNWGGF